MRKRIAILFLGLAVLRPANAVADNFATVPANLEVPAGYDAFLTLHAEGTQQYVCAGSSSSFVWVFHGPQATLVDGSDQQVVTHFLSPNPDEGGAARATWQHSVDTSRVWAAAIASSTDPAYVQADAIPWLLLRVVGDESGPTGGTTMVGTTYIQRIHTAGGVAPALGCKNVKDVGKKALVPYETDYVFYR